MENLLLKRNYHVDGTWYAPQKFLESYKSVVKTGLLNQTSSAGDWSGYILQKIGKTFHVILFWQSNSYPHTGFDVVTDAFPLISFGGEMPTRKELEEMIWSVQNF